LQEGEISFSVYLCAQPYILGPPDDGESGRNMLNEHWNKHLLCLTGFTVIIINIQNTTGTDHLKILMLNDIHPQNL